MFHAFLPNVHRRLPHTPPLLFLQAQKEAPLTAVVTWPDTWGHQVSHRSPGFTLPTSKAIPRCGHASNDCHTGNKHTGRECNKAAACLAIVHAVLPCQGLDEVLQGQVPLHIVTEPNGALDLQTTALSISQHGLTSIALA